MHRRRKKDTLCIKVRAVLIVTGSNLCDTKYEFYGFTDDLRDTINKYNHKAGFCKNKYRWINNHSDSVITYYTRWYTVHFIPTSYLRYPYIT